MVRKKAVESNLPKICTLLPYFILLDKQIGGCAISSVYVQTLCFIALGFLVAQEHTSLEDMVRYCRYATTCIQMIMNQANRLVDAESYDREDLCGFTMADLPRANIFTKPPTRYPQFAVV